MDIGQKPYWKTVADNINEWQEVMNRTLTKKDLRENYIITLAITLTALGTLIKKYIFVASTTNYVLGIISIILFVLSIIFQISLKW